MSWEMIAGPYGAMFLLAAAVVALVKTRLVVPGFYFEASEIRAKALDLENEALNKTVLELTHEVGKLRAAAARLEEQVKGQSAEIVRLTAEVESFKRSR